MSSSDSIRPGRLFIGRLDHRAREADLKDVFGRYGPVMRCDVKQVPSGATNYGFVDFEDRRDAEDALRYEDGREMFGTRIVIEWAKGAPSSWRVDECTICRRTDHIERECPANDRRRGRSPPPRRRDSYRSRSRSPDRGRRPSPPPRRRYEDDDRGAAPRNSRDRFSRDMPPRDDRRSRDADRFAARDDDRSDDRDQGRRRSAAANDDDDREWSRRRRSRSSDRSP